MLPYVALCSSFRTRFADGFQNGMKRFVKGRQDAREVDGSGSAGTRI